MLREWTCCPPKLSATAALPTRANSLPKLNINIFRSAPTVAGIQCHWIRSYNIEHSTYTSTKFKESCGTGLMSGIVLLGQAWCAVVSTWRREYYIIYNIYNIYLRLL